jgi:hypothetical protein
MSDEDFSFEEDEEEEEIENRQCRGTTLRGTRCKLTANGDYTSRGMREAASNLEFSDYCGYHNDQESFEDEEEEESGEEMEEEGDEDDGGSDSGNSPSAQTEGAHFPAKASEPPKTASTGAGMTPPAEYDLLMATGERTPRVAAGTNIPVWVTASRSTWQAHFDPDCRNVQCFNGLIVHKPSNAVVGCVSGQLIKRGPGVVEDCEDYSAETCEMVEDLFSFSEAAGERGNITLKKRHKVGRFHWGGTLDTGHFARIERMELDANHRGKGVLAKLADPLINFCTSHSAASVFAMPGFFDYCVCLATPAALALNTSNVAKLRDSFATMGFRRVGKTDWMAMVTSRAHPCWDPSTHEKPEFPFREVAKTVNDPAMPALLEQCVKTFRSDAGDVESKMRRQRSSDDDRDTAALLVAARAALDAIKAHDPGALFIPAETKGHAGPARLMAQLLWEKSAWKAHKLAPGIERLCGALREFYLP